MNDPEQSTPEPADQEVPLSGTNVGTVQPSRSSTRVVRRKAILSESNDLETPPPASQRSNVTYTVGTHQAGPGSNQRRNRHTLKLITVVVLANNLLIAGAVVWFVYYIMGDLESRLQGPVMPHPTVNATAPASASAAPANTEEIEKRSAAVEAKLNKEIEDLRGQLAEARQGVELGKQNRDETNQKIEQLTRSLANIAAQAKEQPSAKAGGAASSIALSEAQASTELPPSQSELVLLKERNRLTAFADDAIASGSRDAYEQLWKSLSDPRLANLTHAARAEILRVQECYLSGQRAKYYGIQQYQIPIAEVFPDAGSLTAAQLSDDQLIQLLEDKKLPWQARVKAAWYLGRHRTTKVGDALVKAVKEDPMLDVEAEATFSFEQVTGYRAKLFEPENLEAWWISYKSAPPDNNPAKSKDKEKDKDKGKLAEEKGSKNSAKEPPLPTEEPLQLPQQAPPPPMEKPEANAPAPGSKTADADKPKADQTNADKTPEKPAADVKDKEKEKEKEKPASKSSSSGKKNLKSDCDEKPEKKTPKKKAPAIQLREPDEKT